MTWRKLDLTGWILLGLAAGIICGLLQYWLLPADVNAATVRWFHDPIGRIFLNAIRLMVVPLVIVSLTLGTATIGDLRKLGRIGGKTMGIYLLTTAIAIAIGLTLASVVRPGSGLSVDVDVSFEGRVAPPLTDTLVDIVPTNPFEAMVQGKMLQVIFVAMLAGLALAAVKDRAQPLVSLLESADALIQRMVIMIMWIAPLGVFALIAKVIVGEGLAVFVPLLKYMGCVLGALLIHVALVYPTLLTLLARLSPLRFFRNIYPAMIVGFSTSSSNATLPVSMEVAEHRLGTRDEVHAFTLPLGATINMDGTAIMQGVATVFIAGVYGIDLTMTDFLQVILMATLASIGTAGVPGVGLIMLSMVLVEIGLPVEGIGIILGVDRLLDMSRTAVNIAGDLMCTTVVARSEGEFDPEVFGAENL